MGGRVEALKHQQQAQPVPLRVLVAEDHAVHQALERAALEGLGCEVTVVADGLEAIRKAGLKAFDVIVLDRNMPLCNGDTAALHIRLGRGASAGALIVCCSSDEPEGETAALYDAILPKPIMLAAISAMIGDLPRRAAA